MPKGNVTVLHKPISKMGDKGEGFLKKRVTSFMAGPIVINIQPQR